MKVAILHSAHNISIEDAPYPRVEKDGVVIKVKACGICGSDLHIYRHGGTEGTVLGHEFSGDIVEIGANVTGVTIGNRVTAMSGVGCGKCYWCRQDQPIRCRNLKLLGYQIPGAFAQYVSIPGFKIGQYAALLPDNMTYQEAALAEPLSVALYAVMKANPRPEDTAVVIGVGMIGLCIVKLLKTFGVNRIIVSEPKIKRLNLARESGAEVMLDTTTVNVVAKLAEMTRGKGADVVFECAGLSTTYHQALEIVSRGGKVELVALYEQPITWDPSTIVMNDINLIGCGLRWDLPGAINLLQRKEINIQSLITHEYPLEKVKEAFDTQLMSDDAIKVMLIP